MKRLFILPIEMVNLMRGEEAMRAIMVMFDSLNRRFLPNYGCDWVLAPNFQRLSEKTVTYDRFYVSSLPCMPARRDLHTGRPGFLHRSWGPLEPFDNSMPELLKEHGIYTRLISDHGHYWEDGGSTYHSRYSTWECIRGQEADQWSFRTDEPEIPDHVPVMREFTHPAWWRNSWCNKELIHKNGQWPQNQVFGKGLEFLEHNWDKDNWFLQIETFDPHEPFDSPQEFRRLYDDGYDGPHFDWPSYAPVSEPDEVVEHGRKEYAALLSMCDRNLGRVLDFMDEHDMWHDTMLIVNTDHGFMLGEKEWWAKSVMPCYNELANTPFFLWDPCIGVKGERRQALCQTIDIPATLLEFFAVERPAEMLGQPLSQVQRDDSPVRQFGIFGFHGSFVNITDGDYIYMRASEKISNQPLNEYTLLPLHQQGFFSSQELSAAELIPPLSFSKNCKLVKIPVISRLANATFCNSFQYGHLLWDLRKDPEQLTSLDAPQKEAEFINAIIREMKACDAPKEQFVRLGISPEVIYTAKRVLSDREKILTFDSFAVTKKYQWTASARNIFIGMLSLLEEHQVDEYFQALDEEMCKTGSTLVERVNFNSIAEKFYSKDPGKIFFFLNKLERTR